MPDGIHFRGEDLPELLEVRRGRLPAVPAEMTSSLTVQRLPDAPALPAPLRGAFVAHLRIGYLGPAAEGEHLLAPLRAVAPALLDTVGEHPVSGDPLQRDHRDVVAEPGRVLRQRWRPAREIPAGPDARSHRPARRVGDSSPPRGCGPLPPDLSPVKMVT